MYIIQSVYIGLLQDRCYRGTIIDYGCTHDNFFGWGGYMAYDGEYIFDIIISVKGITICFQKDIWKV